MSAPSDRSGQDGGTALGRDVLAGRRIVIGVTGGIAAYKSCSLVSTLMRRGAQVRVVMTRNAARFVTPLTFSALIGSPVEHDMWAERTEDSSMHISLQGFAEALLVVPATANTIGKVASGIADNLLTTSIMAATCPVGFAPAMNSEMWSKPVVQENIAKLRERGCWIVAPAHGRLASGAVGVGRLPSLPLLVSCIERMLTERQPASTDLKGRKVLITGGPTREFMDPVRFMSNASSGKMGYALAQQAAAAGAEVTLVSGTPREMTETLSGGFETVEVTSASEMLAAVQNNIGGADVFISAAAVADYTFAQTARHKMKKGGDTLTVELHKTADIVRWVAESPQRPRLVVGFAAESQEVLSNAAAKLAEKKLDLIVANDITEPGSGFGSDTNRVSILGPDEYRADLPLMSKWAVASALLDEVARRLQ